MSDTTISAQLCEELLAYLDDELASLNRLETISIRIGTHSRLAPLPVELVNDLAHIGSERQQREQVQQMIRSKIAHETGVHPGHVRISRISSDARLQKILKERRETVFQKTLYVQAMIQTARRGLNESNYILSGVLEALFGLQTRETGYDQRGRSVSHTSTQQISLV